MSTFNFADVKIASGTLKMTLVNDVGSDTTDVTGRWILDFGQITEAVEESGQGGVLRIPDVDIEVYDRDDLFKDTIFGPGVTKVQAKILVNDGVNDLTAMFGDVDLGSLQFPSYYDDETGTEYHSCKFTAFSMLKRLEKVQMSELRTALDTHDVSKTTTLGLLSIGIDGDVTQGALTGENFDNNNSIGTIDWQIPSFAKEKDGDYAYIIMDTGQVSHYLTAKGFFLLSNGVIQIPTGATIKGIQFRIICSQENNTDGDGVRFTTAKFIKGGTISGSDLSSGEVFPDLDGAVYIGGPAALGGLPWAASDINDALGFGIALSADVNGTGTTNEGFIDEITCIVFYDLGGVTKSVVLISDILEEVQNQLDLTTETHEAEISQGFNAVLESSEVDTTFPYLYLSLRNTGGGFDVLWDAHGETSFMSLDNVQRFLFTLCGHFLCYPLLVYDPVTDKIHLKLKQRNAGELINFNAFAQLKESNLLEFFKYDAVQAQMVINSRGQLIPAGLKQKQLDAISQKLTLQSYFPLSTSEAQREDDSVEGGIYLYVSSGVEGEVAGVNQIDTGPTLYNQFTNFLATEAFSLWSDRPMYERTYVGVGLGEVEVLDRVSINSTEYTIIEIKRNLIDNEMTIKAVKFS